MIQNDLTHCTNLTFQSLLIKCQEAFYVLVDTIVQRQITLVVNMEEQVFYVHNESALNLFYNDFKS